MPLSTRPRSAGTCGRGRPRLRGQRGLTLVELMVGITIGLFVVAAATMLLTTQLGDNRRLLLETQLQQDLRASADIIVREVRRASHWSAAEAGVWAEVGAPGSPAAQQNMFAPVTWAPSAPGSVEFRYMRRPGEEGPFGFRLHTAAAGDGVTRGVIQTLLGPGGWQDLTDRNVVDITRFSITARHGPPLRVACPTACPGGGEDCWPTLTVREFDIEIAARAVADPALQRALRTTVRLRNDDLAFRFQTGSTWQSCPP